MNARRLRNHLASQSVARFRLMGWVMLMMFTLVRMAPALGSTDHSGGGSRWHTRLSALQASADFSPQK